MEGHVFGDQEQLFQFLRKLKEVFDVCEQDADGFIRVEHLLDLGLQFGQKDEVRLLQRVCDRCSVPDDEVRLQVLQPIW